jgi:hypothetical protein
VNSKPAKAGEFSNGACHPFALQMGIGAQKEVAPMINYVMYENMFAFALVIIGVLALLQNTRK